MWFITFFYLYLPYSLEFFQSLLQMLKSMYAGFKRYKCLLPTPGKALCLCRQKAEMYQEPVKHISL